MSLITPQFVLEDNLWWTTKAILSSWKGFQSRKILYAAEDTPVLSDGTVKIVFAPEGRGNEPLTNLEISTINWVIEHEVSMSEALLLSLLKEYPLLQSQYDYSGKEKAELMPDIKSDEDLRSLIGLSSVNVHQVLKDGIPYVGFEFVCTWDEEHGLGVLMHGTRTIQIGGADTAILLWIAEHDAQHPIMRTESVQ